MSWEDRVHLKMVFCVCIILVRGVSQLTFWLWFVFWCFFFLGKAVKLRLYKCSSFVTQSFSYWLLKCIFRDQFKCTAPVTVTWQTICFLGLDSSGVSSCTTCGCALQTSLLFWLLSPHLHPWESLSVKAFKMKAVIDSWLVTHPGWCQHLSISTFLFLCRCHS